MKLSPEAKTEYKHICSVFDGQDWSENDKKEFKYKVLQVLKRDGKIDYSAFPEKFRWNLCTERLRSGNYTSWEGWEFRSDWAMTFRWGREIRCPVPKWDGRPVKHLTVLGEQGIGDEILFLSAMPELIVRLGREAIEFQTYPRLRKIIERSYGIRCTDRKPLSDVHEGDAVVALGDLFPWYRRDKSHFPRKPYLKADPSRVEHWKEWLAQFGDLPKIGLSWASTKGSVNPAHLMMSKGVYFDLQYRSREVVVHEPPPEVIKPPFDVNGEIDELFAFVAAIDSVHTTTQTLCHIAGSQGKETKVVLPSESRVNGVACWLWYYFNGSTWPHWESPVYPNMTIYRNIDEFRNSVS